MKQTHVVKGAYRIIVTMQGRWVEARLYTGAGDGVPESDWVATMLMWRGKTIAGGKRWAARVLAAA